MHARNGRTITNVDSTNLSSNTSPLRALPCRQQCKTLPKVAPKNLSVKGLSSCEPLSGRCFALTYSPIVSCTHFIPLIPLHWVSNGSKHKNMVLYHVVTRARRPFPSWSLQMASCRKVKYEGAEKASSGNYLAALSNAQRNATHRMPRNAVVNLFHIPHSLFVS